MAFVLDEEMQNVTNIKVIGVGGGGGNAVNRMVEAGLNGVEFVAMNTDQQALVNSKATQKVQLGAKLTKGRGAGADPEVGQRAAEESKDEIANALKGAQMVFITAGMGGGTGTGAAPVVAETAHDLGILTVGIVTKPFAFEGKRKMSIAEQGIANLMMHVDSLIVIPNERLKLISQEKITLMNAFEAADNVLRQGVESISSLINVPAFINLDFADVRSIMKDAGFAHMGVGVAKGAGKAENAAKAAISSPLLETSIAGARGVIINITSSPDIGLDDVETAASMITQSAHPDANIIWGTAFDERLQDEMSITVVATGFESTPGVDEPIQAAMDAQKAAAAAAAPAAPKAEAPKAKSAVDPVIPNPVFSNVFNPNVDTPVSTTPVSQPEPAEEDDGDYFNDLLSILNKRS
ncbi:cell division protein FtsZ [bacterium]|nr:cell division protein FtsZ [bacterium]MCI7744005.1 cell division protein FtsZ [bacterium]MDD5858158.1 cell division protein FtsZ [bacterium]